MKVQKLEPIYFGDLNWDTRLDQWLRERSPEYSDFHQANASHIAESILEGEASLRMVVNIPPDALLGFIEKDGYENTYERKVVMGESVDAVNERRQRVDQLLFDTDPKHYYFGALALGGCGVRFYGDYCMVLRDVDPDTQIMDRNSWDIEFEPLSWCSAEEVVQYLKGKWQHDRTQIAKLKVLPQLTERVRLTTTGTVSDAILHDESFIEVHKCGSFSTSDLYELRESTSGPSIEAQLRSRFEHGQPVTPEEAIWLNRRSLVTRAVGKRKLRTRVVETAGRSR